MKKLWGEKVMSC